MSQAISFYGGKVEFGGDDDASPVVAYKEIPEVQSCEFTGSKVDLADVTHTKSPNRRREFLGTLVDNGDFGGTANLIPGNTIQTDLFALMNTVDTINWRVTTEGGATYDFAGILVTADRSLPFDKEMKLTFKVKVTGEITEG
jgi:hypothetical protein